MSTFGQKPQKSKTAIAQLPMDDWRALALLAEENQNSIAAEIRRAVTAYLKEKGRRT